MGSITTGIGLMSGIDTASLIDQLIALESRGKLRLQQRLSILQQQQSAMLSINSRLLSLKNLAASFRKDNIFQSALAASSNEDVLTATATWKALPGNYTFTVKQLVSTSQQMTKGFASKQTPLGLSSLGFNFGNVTLNRDIDLEHLNGGQGVAPGKISITDAAGNQATVDLTAATTLNEAIDAINSAAGVAVTASVDGDRLVIEDASGGAGSLTIANVGSATTATDLGIAGSSAEGTITGSSIHYLGGSTSLSIFNDGTGALIRNNVTDLRITDRNGAVHNIDLGQLNVNITTATSLSELNDGAGITISDDNDNPDIKFIARDGTEYEVNLTGATTVGGLINRINNQTGGVIQLSITDGNKFTVTDNSGGAGTLQILGAGVNDTATASDLGILNEEGVSDDAYTGEVIPNTLSKAPVSTIQELIQRIEDQTNGAISIAIADSGVALKVIDNTGGAGNLVIESTGGNPHLANHLGIATPPGAGVAADELESHQLIANLGSVLTRNINGGEGLGGGTTLDISDRAGQSVSINDLNTYHSLDELIAAINDEAANAGVGITAQINSSGTGLQIIDTTGGAASNLIIAGDAAAALGIQADVIADTVHGENLNHQFISEATRLADMNYGKGVGNGSVKITDGFGNSITVTINSNQKSLYDVIQSINGLASAQGVAIQARVNDAGSGLLIEENLPDGSPSPTVAIKIESAGGSAAKDLNIIGQSESIQNGAFIDGGYARTISLNETDTLEQVLSKINEAGLPVSASILQTGSGAKPFRISFTSGITGKNGELVIDTGGVNLMLTTLSKGQDAKVFFGEAGAESGFLVTSNTNTVKDVVDGLTLNLKSASDSPVTVSVSRDVEKITGQVESLVNAFNEAIAKIDEFDFYDIDEEERGLLLGNPTTGRVRSALFRAIQQPAEGVSGQYQRLHQIGIRIGSGGQLEFNQSAFEAAFAEDPQAVENLLAAFETQTTPPQQVGEGITVGGEGQQTVVRGIGQILDDLLDGLTDQFDGTMKRADENFNNQIKLINERIEAFDVRMEARRKQLERQFAAMERALAQIQNQSGALMSMQSNLLMASSALQR